MKCDERGDLIRAILGLQVEEIHENLAGAGRDQVG